MKPGKKSKKREISKSSVSKKRYKKPTGSLRERMRNHLKVSQFRYLNERLYMSTSSEAEEHFKSNPEEFKAYHSGYKLQVSQWPVNPVDVIIEQLKKINNKKLVVADFGCGDAKIAASLNAATVHSFDLITLNERVTACDMAHTKLFANTVDVAVFCLSLMGTNLSSFIREANRVLKEGGLLKIAEVESRFENVEDFVKGVEKFGFESVRTDFSAGMFYFLNFKKTNALSKSKKKKLPELTLKPCLYKKR